VWFLLNAFSLSRVFSGNAGETKADEQAVIDGSDLEG
jgi:hypothetical protein